MTWSTCFSAASSCGSCASAGGTASCTAPALRGFVHLLGIVAVDQRAHGLLRRQGDPLVIAPHEDRLPRAVAGAELAADAALQVHLDELHEVAELRPGHDLDAVDRTEGDAGLAAGTAGLVDHRQLLGRLRAGRFVDFDLLLVRKLGHTDRLRCFGPRTLAEKTVTQSAP